MRFLKSFKPELCVSDNATRPVLHHVHYDPARKQLAATDGKTLAIIPCTPGDEDAPGPALVNPEAIQAARKKAGRDPFTVLHVQPDTVSVAGGAFFPAPRFEGKSAGESARSYPPYERVVPAFKAGDEGTATLYFDAKLLLQLANAMGDHRVRVTVALDSKLKLGPILVEPYHPNGASGVLMPMSKPE